jgi:hypothetical protein
MNSSMKFLRGMRPVMAAGCGRPAVTRDVTVPAVFDLGWNMGACASGDMTDISAFFLSALKALSAREIPANSRNGHAKRSIGGLLLVLSPSMKYLICRLKCQRSYWEIREIEGAPPPEGVVNVP